LKAQHPGLCAFEKISKKVPYENQPIHELSFFIREKLIWELMSCESNYRTFCSGRNFLQIGSKETQTNSLIKAAYVL
jgi:hypothetical protein